MSQRDWADRFRPAPAAGEPAEREAAAETGRPRGRLPLALVALAGALLIGWLIVRYSAVNALLEVDPDLAAGLSGTHPDVRLERAFERLQLTGGPDPATRAAALAAFRHAALSEVPLLIAAREAIAAGDVVRADRLIALASRRNPRSRYARLLELDQHIRLGRTAEAATAMAVLTRSFPDARRLLTGQLARMAVDPASRDAVRRAMAADPQLTAGVLEQLARRGEDPETILALAGDRPPPAAGGETPAWQRLMLDNMVERGRVREAQAAWLRLTGADPGGLAGGIYDRDFAGLPGPPPFNWQLETGSDGFAERTANSLHVEYYGRRDARLAGQLLLLPPGRYRLVFTAAGDAEGGEGGRLAWTVHCHPGGNRVAAIVLTGVDFSGKRITGDFVVPERDCPGQWLRLIGNSAEFPKDQQVTIRELRIEGAGLR